MGIISRFTMRSLARNRARTIVSIIGIVLASALLTAVFTTVSSAEHMYIDQTMDSEGTWEVFEAAATDEALDGLGSDRNVASALVSSEIAWSWAEVPDAAGSYAYPIVLRTVGVPLRGGDDAASRLSVQPNVVEGRLPEAEGEVCLPESARGTTLVSGSSGHRASSDGALGIGSTLTIDLLHPVSEDGSPVSCFFVFNIAVDGSEGIRYQSHTDGVEGIDVVRMVDAGETRSFEVVGFFEDQIWARNDLAATEVGVAWLVSAAEPELADHAAVRDVWVDSTGIGGRSEFKEHFSAFFGEEDYFLHNTLLRTQGITDGETIWDAFYRFADVLALIIAIAAINLIYNSFAISVAERTREFGLLSSLGASRFQLMRSVFVEALGMGIVGIPIGVLCGMGGVHVVLGIVSEAMNALLSEGHAFNSLTLHPDPRIIAVVVALSFVVVLVSAIFPAIRAGRVSAIDAIRQTQDIRLTGRAAKRLARAQAEGIEPRKTLLERVMGVPGLLASRAFSRAGAKNRVVTASLAVSVSLLVIAGSIAVYMDPLLDIVRTYGGAGSTDIEVSIVDNGLYAGRMPTEDMRAAFDEVVDATAGIDGVEQVNATLRDYVAVAIPQGMLAPDMRTAIDAGAIEFAYPEADEPFVTRAFVYYVSDEDFAAYAREAGVADTALPAGSDPGVPALLVNYFQYSASESDPGMYAIATPYAGTGTITAFELASEYEGGVLVDSVRREDGYDGPIVVYSMTDGSPYEDWPRLPFAEAVEREGSIDVIALLDRFPDDVVGRYSWLGTPSLIMPMSAIDGTMFGIRDGSVMFSVEEGLTPFKAEDRLWVALNASSAVSSEHVGVYLTDYLADVASARTMFNLINLFVGLFTVITMLIAIANVFNTLSNSIILRTREFAMLQSCGMDQKQFARMLLAECGHYAWRGLAWGLVLSSGASLLLWAVMREVSGSIPFAIPWGHILLAAISVVFVLALSVAYALRRSHALNVVEALRADAI